MRWFATLSILAVAACDGGADNGDTDTNDSDVPTEQIDRVLALTADTADGETVYTANCVACHATDGTGGIGSDLTAEVPNLTTREVAEVVISGKGAMAGFGSTLSDQDIADVTAYVEAEFGS